jgi:hypothetical protein
MSRLMSSIGKAAEDISPARMKIQTDANSDARVIWLKYQAEKEAGALHRKHANSKNGKALFPLMTRRAFENLKHVAGRVTSTTKIAMFVSWVKFSSMQAGRSTFLPIMQAVALLGRNILTPTLTWATPSLIPTLIYR